MLGDLDMLCKVVLEGQVSLWGMRLVSNGERCEITNYANRLHKALVQTACNGGYPRPTKAADLLGGQTLEQRTSLFWTKIANRSSDLWR